MSLFQQALKSHLLRKSAYLPLTPAAQQAAAQPPPQGDPNMQGGAPMPPPPQDPSMMQGGMPPMPPEQPMPPQGDPNMQGQPMPPQQGAPNIQIIQGPNGMPIDAETGLVVLDPQQGIEQCPLTGIIFNKMTGEFTTPDGQPMDPNQAMQELSAARQGSAPAPQGQPMPPQDPSMMQGGAPMPPPQGQPMMQQQANDPMAMQDPSMMTQDPSMMQEQAPAPIQGELDQASGMTIDPKTGLPIDPATGGLIDITTGQVIDPHTGAVMPSAPQGNAPMFSEDPEVQAFVKETQRALQTNEKQVRRVSQDLNGLRTDLQGLRREIEKQNDNADTLLARLDNVLTVAEAAAGKQGAVEPIQGM